MSFGSVADDYDRLRPSPPDQALDWLFGADLDVVVDLGAGTGAMTRQLEPRACRVIAVEPDDRMRAVLSRRSPGIEALAGRSDAIPLPDESADALVVSSAWHWMDPDTTVPEVARVLRDGGTFAVVWNGRDGSAPLIADLTAAVQSREVAEGEHRARRARALELPPGSPFGAVASVVIPFTRSMTVTELAESFGTYSRVITLGPDGRAEAIQRAKGFLADRYGADAVIDVPMASRAFRTVRLPR